MIVEKLVGERCWYVSAGGATSPTFLLVFGGKRPRETPLSNPKQSDEFRHNRGELELLVWSAWRWRRGADVITTSDTGVEGLKALVGVTVTRVQCAAPMSDLTLELDDGTTLETFSHRDVNWECWVGPEYVER